MDKLVRNLRQVGAEIKMVLRLVEDANRKAVAAKALLRRAVGNHGEAIRRLPALSPREREIFLDIDVLSRGDIAAKYGIRPKTVNVYFEHLKAKLHAKNIAQVRDLAREWKKAGFEKVVSS